MVNSGLSTELTAMQEIATALHQLDPPTRTRVLHWVQERFQGDAPPVESATPALTATAELRAVPPPANATDEALSVGTLTDFFGPRGPTVQTEPSAQSVPGMLHEFVTEFQDLARAWNADGGAAADEQRAKPRLSVAS